MEFKTMDAAGYRALDADAFEARRAEVIAELENENGVPYEQLRAEVAIIEDEIQRRADASRLSALNGAQAVRASMATAVANGAGTVVAASNEPKQSRGAFRVVSEEDPYNTMEYRRAFMDLVTRGRETRADAFTLTTDAPVVIPTTLSNKIVHEVSEHGVLYPRVNKTSIKGGIDIPVATLNPVASWVGEEEVTDFQNAKADTKISFTYHEFECRLGLSFLASATTLDEFQALFVQRGSEAIADLLDQAILNGNGTTQPLGIFNDTRITTDRADQVVELTAEDLADWKTWYRKIVAVMPKSYRDGAFYFAQSTWDKNIITMSDNDNAPIVDGYNPHTGDYDLRLVGKSVITTEDTLFPDFEDAGVGDFVGMFADLSTYTMNWQPGEPLTTVRYPDYDKRQNKIVTYGAVDGRVVEPFGYVLIKKKASA